MQLHALEPTTLFRSGPGGLLQQARATLTLDGPLAGARLVVETGGQRAETAGGDLPAGEHHVMVDVPDVAGDVTIALTLKSRGGVEARWEVPWRRQRKWTVFVMPTSHIDIYSTALAEGTPEEHAVILDAAVDLCARFPSYRYQVENTLPFFEYPGQRPRGQVERLAALAREGRIGFGAQFTGFHHAEASGEAMLQGQFLPLRELEARYGIRPNCGYTVDVPNATRQYVQVLARMGIRGWIFSPNRWPPPDGWYGLGEAIRGLPRLSWAEAPDGSRLLLWLPHEHYGQQMAQFGLVGEGGMDEPAARADEALRSLEAEGYPLDEFLLEFSYGDNLPPEGTLPERLEQWQQRWAYPRFVLATAGDFFETIASRVDGLPAVCPEFPDLWAFLVANQGVLNELDRRALTAALDAEALWSLALTRGRAPWPDQAVQQAFAQMGRFHSHDWWYGGGQTAGVPDLAKARFGHEAQTLAEGARQAAVEALGRDGGAAGDDAVTVVNPNGFPLRGPAAAAASPTATAGDLRSQLVDAASYASHFAAEPYSVAHPPASTAEPRPRAVFVAGPVAGLGATPVRLASPAQSLRHENTVIESPFYRVTFDEDAGAVTSLVDLEAGRELLAPDGEGLAALLLGRPALEGFGIGFVGSREEGVERVRSSLKTWERMPLSLQEGLSGPVFSSLVLRGAVESSPVTQVVVVYRELKRVDITTTIEWDNQSHMSRLVAAFPFALDTFETRHETPFAHVRPGLDEGPTPGALRLGGTWVSFRQPGLSVVVATPDTPVLSLGRADLNPIDDAWYRVPERTTAYCVIQENGAPSPLVQPGRLVARFSLTSATGTLPPADCARFGWSVLRPLLAVGGSGGREGMTVEPGHLVVTAVKPAWDGSGIVVRLVETDGRGGEAAIRLPFAVRRARRCDPIEHVLDNLGVADGEVRLPFGPHEIVTLLVEQ